MWHISMWINLKTKNTTICFETTSNYRFNDTPHDLLIYSQDAVPIDPLEKQPT